MALHCKRTLEINWTVSLSFRLPTTSDLIHVTGRVANANANADGSGRIGICFSFVPDNEFDLLVNWLAIELAKLENAEIPFGDALGKLNRHLGTTPFGNTTAAPEEK